MKIQELKVHAVPSIPRGNFIRGGSWVDLVLDNYIVTVGSSYLLSRGIACSLRIVIELK